MPVPESTLDIAGQRVGEDCAVYFVADIAANHDGNLGRAKELVRLAAEAGADAAKFQHFAAKTIVSDKGFRALGQQISHQAKWGQTVFQVYQAAAVSLEWTEAIVETCKEVGIAFFTSPYSLELVDAIDPFVPAYKIGSGDITWLEIIEHIAGKNKPYMIAAGASSMDEVAQAVNTALRINRQIVLMQCNTNYTASLENFQYIQLNVLRSFALMYPRMILGLSDHTPGHSTVLGAVALGAKVIEKHFTDDTARSGPDHLFSMDPRGWREMVDRTRELERALGTGVKQVEENEQQTVVLQRRAIRLLRDVEAGETVAREHLTCLRPCPADALPPYRMADVVGKRARRNLQAEECLRWTDLE
jgi:sialic acid synthase SpsE